MALDDDCGFAGLGNGESFARTRVRDRSHVAILTARRAAMVRRIANLFALGVESHAKGEAPAE